MFGPNLYRKLLRLRYRIRQNAFGQLQQHCCYLHVLGIESSCDDAAVSIVNYEKREILSDRRSSDFTLHGRAGGIIPFASARHHRDAIPRLINEALEEAGMRASDINAVAVSNRPGLVLSLKAGIENALNFARDFRRPLIPVHHMRAHALVMRLMDASLDFPFCTLLISGGHCQICLVSSPFKFQTLAEASKGSPGECLDKLARRLGIQPVDGHYGAAMERMAKSSSLEGHLKFRLPLPAPKFTLAGGMELDYDDIKTRYISIIKSRTKSMDQNEINDLCASIQDSVIEYTCKHLEPALAFLASKVPEFVADCKPRKLVVAGGVAANEQFFGRICEVASADKFTVSVPPKHLCTDNGVMIAWTGAEIFNQLIHHNDGNVQQNREEKKSNIYWPNQLPDAMWASSKAKIGPTMEWSMEKKEEEEKESKKVELDDLMNQHQNKSLREHSLISHSI